MWRRSFGSGIVPFSPNLNVTPLMLDGGRIAGLAFPQSRIGPLYVSCHFRFFDYQRTEHFRQMMSGVLFGASVVVIFVRSPFSHLMLLTGMFLKPYIPITFPYRS